MYLVVSLGKKANAYTSSNQSGNIAEVGELWNSSSSSFNSTTSIQLINMLSNSASGSISTITSNINASTNTIKGVQASTLRGYTYGKSANQSIVVTLGGQKWIVMFLSQAKGVDKDSDGTNDLIATLWQLDAGVDSEFGNSGSYYGADNDTGYPTAMYGTSYIRAVTLNNGGSYLNITSNSNPTSIGLSATASSSHTYASYTHSSSALRAHLVQPQNVSWQEVGQDARTYAGSSNMLSNENWSKSITDDGFVSAKDNYADKTNSDAWKTDYLWLPSLSETGYNDTYSGIWGTNQNERSNGAWDYYAWLRSSRNYNTTYAYVLRADGSSCITRSVDYTYAVRPALHLNLSSVLANLVYLVTLDNQDGTSTQIGVNKNSAMPSITPPTRTGYTFNGYYTSTNGGGTKYYNANGTSAKTYPATGGPTTLYAYWTLNNYTLTINPNGGQMYHNLVEGAGADWEGATSKHNMNLTYSASEAKYTMTNTATSDPYCGSNSYVSLTAGKSYSFHLTLKNNSTGALHTSNSIQIFYAINWGFNESQSSRFNGDTTNTMNNINSTGLYRFRFDNDTGIVVDVVDFWIAESTKSTSSYSRDITYQQFYNIVPPTRAGYVFAGWDISGAGTTVSNNIVRMGHENTTLTAKWTPITYQIKYDPNGGTGEMANSTHTYDTAKNLSANTFTKRTYEMIGWSTNKTATTATYANEQSIKNLTTTNGEIVTFYAIWRYVIGIYDAPAVSATYGGIAQIIGADFKNMSATDKITLKAYPCLEGYTFVGWYELAGTTATQISTQPIETFNKSDIYELQIEARFIDARGGVVGGLAGGNLNNNIVDSVVTATLGGSASIVGDNYANLAPTDTISLVANIVIPSYEFVGWYLIGETDTLLSTAQSVKLTKSTINNRLVEARFKSFDSDYLNTETNN